ncbi:FAD-dependent oxidoreductase [Gallaecimonas sp. GXIMD4217]|uniref:NAD(P)/FAD-dependent oxidoreductase n=1 Tax=Gallaecimonas sp. GXIMD4217 TaxID=3131927 RepID=UPI00311AE41C
MSAGRLLHGQGHQVSLFEKSRGTGGRMVSRRTPWGSFDLGAQYFTARHPRFIDELGNWQALGIAGEWHMTPYQLSLDQLHPSPDVTSRFVGQPHMSVITRRLADSLEVHFNEQIVACHVRDQRWWLETVQGEARGPFDGLLVTTPAQQSVPLLQASPRLALAARQVKMLPCWAVGLAFAEPLDTIIKAAFVTDDCLEWLAEDSSKPQRMSHPQCWVLHATSEWSREFMEAEPEDVVSMLGERFFELLRLTPTEPMAGFAHRWRFARPAESHGSRILFDTSLKLGAGGDWSHGGRMEGAYLAGLDLAERMLQQLD